MNRAQRRRILAAMKCVREKYSGCTQGPAGHGICYEVMNLFLGPNLHDKRSDVFFPASPIKLIAWLQDFFVDWPEHSGDLRYPVEDERELDLPNPFCNPKRMRLLNWAIAKLQPMTR